MKKFLVIPLMFIYLLSVSGMVYYAHYCGTDLVSLNVYAEGEGCDDGGCGDESEEPDDCCSNEVVAAKVTVDQNSTEVYKLKFSPLAVALLPLTYYYNDCAACAVHYTSTVQRANAPPGLWQSLPLYKLHSSFTYYG